MKGEYPNVGLITIKEHCQKGILTIGTKPSSQNVCQQSNNKYTLSLATATHYKQTTMLTSIFFQKSSYTKNLRLTRKIMLKTNRISLTDG